MTDPRARWCTRRARAASRMVSAASLSGTGPPTEWFHLEKSQSQKSARIISVAEVAVCRNLELLACETCRGHIRRARDRPNPPKGA